MTIKINKWLSPFLGIVGVISLIGGTLPLVDLLHIIQSPRIVSAIVIEKVPRSPTLLPSHDQIVLQYWVEDAQYDLSHPVKHGTFESLNNGELIEIIVDEQNPSNVRFEEGEVYSIGGQMMPLFLGILALYFAIKTKTLGKR